MSFFLPSVVHPIDKPNIPASINRTNGRFLIVELLDKQNYERFGGGGSRILHGALRPNLHQEKEGVNAKKIEEQSEKGWLQPLCYQEKKNTKKSRVFGLPKEEPIYLSENLIL